MSSEHRLPLNTEIDRDADHLEVLIGDLLDMSHLVSGGSHNFERTSTAPAVLVSRGLDRVRGRLSNSPVEIDPGLGTLPGVWVDARRIEQVFANLVEKRDQVCARVFDPHLG
jgi:signal transduction histidine kinase